MQSNDPNRTSYQGGPNALNTPNTIARIPQLERERVPMRDRPRVRAGGMTGVRRCGRPGSA